MKDLFGNLEMGIWLLAPAALALVIVLAARNRRRLTRLFIAAALLPRMALHAASPYRRWKAGLLVAAVSLFALSMMRPRWGTVYQKVERKGIDVVFVVDLSKSMLADDVKPTRLQRVVLEIKQFVETILQNDRIALVGFAGVSHIFCPLTHDYGAFRLFLDDMDPKLIPRGGTATADALYKAMETSTDDEPSHKAIVLFTDGEDHEGNPERAAEEAAKRGIRIFTIGVGSPEGALIPIVDEQGNRTYLKDDQGQVVKTRLDETTLEKIALLTNGAYKRLSGGESALPAIYEQMSKIEAKTLESRQEKRYVDRFQWFAGLGLLLLAVESFLPEARRARARKKEDLRLAA